MHDVHSAYLGARGPVPWEVIVPRRERDVWDQLQQQKDLLANANELLSVRSAEAEDLRLCCADMKAEAAMA